MKNLRAVPALVALLVCMTSAPVVRAQYVETRVENAEVVYVEGNDVVLKFAGGEVRQFVIPDSSKFTIDGQDVTVHGLTPGMRLTAVIGTATAPRWVDTVEVTEVGAVWKTVGNNLVIKTPEGENRMYRVPAGSKITLNGIAKTVDQLHEGDRITATVVKTSPPPEPGKPAPIVRKAPPTPPRVGALLIEEDTKPVESPGTWATPALILLVVVLLVAATVTLLASRRKRKA
jgi:hypothetical protein